MKSVRAIGMLLVVALVLTGPSIQLPIAGETTTTGGSSNSGTMPSGRFAAP